MEFLRQEVVYKQEVVAQGQINTINLGYSPDGYHQLPVMVELKPVGEAIASTLAEDQRVQLFNINPVQFAQAGQIQYVQALPPLQYQGKPFGQRTVDTQTVPQPVEVKTEALQCNICGNLYKNSQSLARHHATHAEVPKTFNCHHCNKMFGNQQALRRHQTKHPDIEYEWKCRFCPQSFPYKTTLSKHIKVHAGEKLFKCETCLKRFGNRYQLLRHAKIHTGDVPYKCDICEKGFLKASDFSRHIRTHTGERPFECPQCFKSFTQKSCLVKHCEKKHNAFFDSELVTINTTILSG